ncbi:MAG: hypothetical protein ACLQGU_08155 [bacterium]
MHYVKRHDLTPHPYTLSSPVKSGEEQIGREFVLILGKLPIDVKKKRP